MNAFPVLSAIAIASSGLPATATSLITGISESSTRFAVTTDVAPMAETEPGSSPNFSRRKSATPSDSMMKGYVLALRMIVFEVRRLAESGTSIARAPPCLGRTASSELSVVGRRATCGRAWSPGSGSEGCSRC